MRKTLFILVAAVSFSSFFISCRDEVKEEADDVEIMESDDNDDVENTLEEGVDEIEENTGTGGTDDV